MRAEPDPRLRFASILGDFFAGAGLPPIRGRVLGYLAMSEEPVAFSDLACALDVSRGSVSESTRLLEERGVIQRLRIDGDRRDHFAICDAARSDHLDKLIEEHRATMAKLADFRRQHALSDVLGRRLDDFESFHSGVTKALEALADRS